MIYFYSGSPGSGKSLHLARDIYVRLNRSKSPYVVANFEINLNMITNKKAKFIYKENKEMTLKWLLEYAYENHNLGSKNFKENQTLLVFDEAHTIWNSRDWQKNKDRSEWLTFFSQHRKLGYNIIIISQSDIQLDKQIRVQFEYEVKHRKINNFKIGKFLPVSTFIAVTYWYGIEEKIDSEMFFYRKKWGKFYDSFGTFSMDSTLAKLIDVDLKMEASLGKDILLKNKKLKQGFTLGSGFLSKVKRGSNK